MDNSVTPRHQKTAAWILRPEVTDTSVRSRERVLNSPSSRRSFGRHSHLSSSASHSSLVTATQHGAQDWIPRTRWRSADHTPATLRETECLLSPGEWGRRRSATNSTSLGKAEQLYMNLPAATTHRRTHSARGGEQDQRCREADRHHHGRGDTHSLRSTRIGRSGTWSEGRPLTPPPKESEGSPRQSKKATLRSKFPLMPQRAYNNAVEMVRKKIAKRRRDEPWKDKEAEMERNLQQVQKFTEEMRQTIADQQKEINTLRMNSQQLATVQRSPRRVPPVVPPRTEATLREFQRVEPSNRNTATTTPESGGHSSPHRKGHTRTESIREIEVVYAQPERNAHPCTTRLRRPPPSGPPPPLPPRELAPKEGHTADPIYCQPQDTRSILRTQWDKDPPMSTSRQPPKVAHQVHFLDTNPFKSEALQEMHRNQTSSGEEHRSTSPQQSHREWLSRQLEDRSLMETGPLVPISQRKGFPHKIRLPSSTERTSCPTDKPLDPLSPPFDFRSHTSEVPTSACSPLHPNSSPRPFPQDTTRDWEPRSTPSSPSRDILRPATLRYTPTPAPRSGARPKAMKSQPPQVWRQQSETTGESPRDNVTAGQEPPRPTRAWPPQSTQPALRRSEDQTWNPTWGRQANANADLSVEPGSREGAAPRQPLQEVDTNVPRTNSPSAGQHPDPRQRYRDSTLLNDTSSVTTNTEESGSSPGPLPSQGTPDSEFDHIQRRYQQMSLRDTAPRSQVEPQREDPEAHLVWLPGLEDHRPTGASTNPRGRRKQMQRHLLD